MKNPKRAKRPKGFTLVEVIVVLVILAILAAIIVFAYIQFIKKSEEKACNINRQMIVREYTHLKYFDATLQLKAALKDIMDETGYRCPSGGTYTVNDEGEVVCNKHGNLVAEEPDDPSVIKLPDGTEIKITGDWAEALAAAKAAASENGVLLSKGTVYSDGEFLYIIASGALQLTKTDGKNNISIADKMASQSANIIKINTTSPALTRENVASGGSWNADSLPKKGSVYSYNGSLYVCMVNTTGPWEISTNPEQNSANWVKIK